MKDPIAIVAPAINPANLATALRKLVDAAARAEQVAAAAEKASTKAREDVQAARLAVGRQLVEDRKHWPHSGPRAKGWGEHLQAAGINDRTARDWMALAGYVEKISAPGTEISSTAPIAKFPTRREVATARREPTRVIVDHSQDAAGAGDEPAWQEPTYVAEGEAQAPTAKPCRLCGMVPGGKPTKLASTCKNGCGHSATRTGAATPAPATPQALPAVAAPRQLSIIWPAVSAVATSVRLGAETLRRAPTQAGISAMRENLAELRAVLLDGERAADEAEGIAPR